MLHESMDAGLQKLIDGNRRFVSGHLTSPHQSIERRRKSSGRSPLPLLVVPIHGCPRS